MSGGVIPRGPPAENAALSLRIKEALDHLRSVTPARFDPIEFDRRPGDLEATRGLASVAAVVGCKPPYAEQFGVTVFLRPRRGDAAQVHLSIEEAESLATSLLQMAQLCRAPGTLPGERE